LQSLSHCMASSYLWRRFARALCTPHKVGTPLKTTCCLPQQSERADLTGPNFLLSMRCGRTRNLQMCAGWLNHVQHRKVTQASCTEVWHV
jgi:hypothetical protein